VRQEHTEVSRKRRRSMPGWWGGRADQVPLSRQAHGGSLPQVGRRPRMRSVGLSRLDEAGAALPTQTVINDYPGHDHTNLYALPAPGAPMRGHDVKSHQLPRSRAQEVENPIRSQGVWP
jgi:hypothetical protein